MPLNFAFWGGLHPTGRVLMHDINLSVWSMLAEIAFVIIVPFAVGITINRLWPGAARIGHRVIGSVSFVALGAVIIIGIANNWDIFIHHLGVVLIAVFLHDALALLIGYAIAHLTRLPGPSTKAMTWASRC